MFELYLPFLPLLTFFVDRAELSTSQDNAREIVWAATFSIRYDNETNLYVKVWQINNVTCLLEQM